MPQLEVEMVLSSSSLPALNAWQLRPGEVLTVVDPQQTCYRARITSLDPDNPACVPFAACPESVESPLAIQVYHALPEKERFELILEKLTELGATRIVPVETDRSTTLAARDASQKKSHRWPHLLRRASRQCRRAMLPELCAPVDFSVALDAAAEAELTLLPYEGDAPWSFREAIGELKPESVALLIGPEGGFSAEEVGLARDRGILPIHLGPRILRTETAAIAAVVMVQGFLGDLG